MPSPIARPDISAGDERPESGIIRDMGLMVDSSEFHVGMRVGFHQSKGHEWVDTEGTPWIILEASEVRVQLPEGDPVAPS